MQLHRVTHEPEERRRINEYRTRRGRRVLVKGWRSNQQRFCGPGALSAILGITAEEGARLLNKARGKLKDTPIRGVSNFTMMLAIRRAGITAEPLEVESRFGTRRASEREWIASCRYGSEVVVSRNDTLAKWARERDYATRRSLCLVVCGRHFVVVKGGWICDNQQNRIPIEDSRHKRKRVSSVWRLSKSSPESLELAS